jgi:multidrug resistance efflux pump
VDIIRDTKPQKKKKRIVIGSVVVVVVAVLFFGVRALPTAAPTVERASIWTDTVEQGTMIRMVRGPGTLVPEQARWLTAVTNGRIEVIHILPGAEVAPGDVIMEMSNPDVQMQLLDAQTQLSAARSALTQLRSNLQTQQLNQRSNVETVRTQYLDAKRQYETNQKLFDTNPDLVAQADLDRSREQMEELETRLGLAHDQLEVLESSSQEQIDAQIDQVRRLEEQVEFNRDRLASLRVTTPVGGVLAPLDVPLQEGQWVQSGQQIGRVVVPGRLKAEIRIPQTQAQEIVVGQTAHIDTRSDTIDGRVTRIDPAVRNGTVTIDVSLPDDLPPSARPDLSVDGNVVIERLDDVIYVGRPTFGQANQQVSLFRITDDGEYAERVTVLLGAASVNDIEVREGLQPGDIVILSDMSNADGFDRVRLR